MFGNVIGTKSDTNLDNNEFLTLNEYTDATNLYDKNYEQMSNLGVQEIKNNNEIVAESRICNENNNFEDEQDYQFFQNNSTFENMQVNEISYENDVDNNDFLKICKTEYPMTKNLKNDNLNDLDADKCNMATNTTLIVGNNNIDTDNTLDKKENIINSTIMMKKEFLKVTAKTKLNLKQKHFYRFLMLES